EGFQFSDSKALTADGTHFVGLAIDEENQFELTDQRIERWCTQLLRELHLNST
ncbi:MAG: flavodoxin II, partial [Porticoccus sp.]